MADYVLTDGVATSVRQSDSLEEGYVDVDMDEVDDTYVSVVGSDRLLVQRGVTTLRTATVAVLTSGLQTTLVDVDWLNRAYLY